LSPSHAAIDELKFFDSIFSQLTHCLAGKVRPKVDVVNNIESNNANIIEKMSIQLV